MCAVADVPSCPCPRAYWREQHADSADAPLEEDLKDEAGPESFGQFSVAQMITDLINLKGSTPNRNWITVLVEALCSTVMCLVNMLRQLHWQKTPLNSSKRECTLSSLE